MKMNQTLGHWNESYLSCKPVCQEIKRIETNFTDLNLFALIIKIRIVIQMIHVKTIGLTLAN